MRDEPTARGHLAYEARTSAHAHGAPVSGDATALSLSLLVALAAVGLYHKLTKERALEHETRRRILAMLEEEPSLGTMDIANRLEVCYRTARHHLEVLARFDLVVQAEHRGSWRWARPENTAAMHEEHVPKIQQRMLALLEKDPGLHLSEIARRLDAAKATVKLHLDRLDEGGRVRDERVGPLRRFFPVEDEAPGSRETSP